MAEEFNSGDVGSFASFSGETPVSWRKIVETRYKQSVKKMLEEKPLVSANGIDVRISLIEPLLFLQGFEQRHMSEQITTVLRGSLHLRVTKPAKIKAVTLTFHGDTVTKWPKEGIPPRRIKFEEIATIMDHTWPIFNAQFLKAAAGANTDHVGLLGRFSGSVPAQQGLLGSSIKSFSKNLDSSKANRLPLQFIPLWNFLKGDFSNKEPLVTQNEYWTFDRGDYIYNFELPLDNHLPETIELELGSVRYELKAIVKRAGAFCTDLVGSKDVTLIRTPAEGSLEQIEPIAVSRNWKDQLHMSVVVSGRSFPLGAQIPISFRLTPLANVQFHCVKVFATEHTEYFCSDKRVHRIEPVRKIQLLEKPADVPPTNTISGSLMRTVSSEVAISDQNPIVSKVQIQGPKEPLDSLIGDVSIVSKEMELLVQLPSCYKIKDNDKSSRLHSDTTYQNIKVYHWLKIVMRLSTTDQTDSTKRRYFDISVNSPFRILSHQATEAITTLPAYSAPQSTGNSQMPEPGCPMDPEVYCNARFYFFPTSDTPTRSQEKSIATLSSLGLASLQQRHIYGSVDSSLHRSTHLFRPLSFHVPVFEDEGPPLSLEAPPPLYEPWPHYNIGFSDN